MATEPPGTGSSNCTRPRCGGSTLSISSVSRSECEASPGLRRKDCPRTRFRPDAAHSRQRSSGAPTPRTAPGQHMATAMDAAPPIRLNGACYWQNPRRAQAWRSHFSWDARRSQRASALSEDHPKRRKRKCPRRRCRPRTTSWNRSARRSIVPQYKPTGISAQG